MHEDEPRPADERLERLYQEPHTARERHYGLMFRELPLPGGEGRGEGPRHD
jgi:hypothetical protein